jgi:hypothetical protein
LTTTLKLLAIGSRHLVGEPAFAQMPRAACTRRRSAEADFGERLGGHLAVEVASFFDHERWGCRRDGGSILGWQRRQFDARADRNARRQQALNTSTDDQQRRARSRRRRRERERKRRLGRDATHADSGCHEADRGGGIAVPNREGGRSAG